MYTNHLSGRQGRKKMKTARMGEARFLIEKTQGSVYQCRVYMVLEVQDRGINRYGPSVVLKLENKNGMIEFVWAPVSLVYAMRCRTGTEYIFNKGMKQSEKDNIYYDFGLS